MQTLTSVRGNSDVAAGLTGLARRGSARQAQRGSAIIGALLIVGIVTILAASLMARQTAFIRTLQSDQTGIQVRMLLRSGIDWASAMLRAEGARTPVVQMAADWAMPVRNTRFGDGDAHDSATFSGRISDEQGKFNLRNLVRDGGLAVDQVEIFRRLCATIGVPSEVADRITRRVLIAQPRGADNSASEGAGENQDQEPKTVGMARVPMIRTINDLRPVSGVTQDVLVRLNRVATVLPVGTAVNANTASAEVIAAVIPGVSLGQARSLVAQRDQGQWFINRGDIINRLARPDLHNQDVRIGIGSNWFLLSGAVFTDRSTTVAHVLLQRTERNQVNVFWSREGK